jgi:hypothetical protein
LDELVPEFLDAIPLARWTFSNNRFHYHRGPSTEGAILSYTSRPPFGRDVYDVDARTWRWVD